MTELYLPEHIARKKIVEDAKAGLDAAYVAPEERVLDPSKLPQDAIDRLPQPTGWRILILPYRGKAKSKGGIIITDETRERESLATVCGYVLRMGSDCYKDPDRYSGGPWCKEGQWVIFGRYAGSRFKIEGGEVRIVNDDEIIGTIADPNDIIHV